MNRKVLGGVVFALFVAYSVALLNMIMNMPDVRTGHMAIAFLLVTIGPSAIAGLAVWLFTSASRATLAHDEGYAYAASELVKYGDDAVDRLEAESKGFDGDRSGFDEGIEEALQDWRDTDTISRSIREVAKECYRQTEQEGFTVMDDLGYAKGRLSVMAGCYLLFSEKFPEDGHPPKIWPAAPEYWKPRDFHKNVVRGAALAVRELVREQAEEEAEKEEAM